MLGLMLLIVVIGLLVGLCNFLPIIPAEFKTLVLWCGIIFCVCAIIGFFFFGFRPLAGIHPVFAM